MLVQINWLGVVLATLSSMVVGTIWYAKPVFGNTWTRLVEQNGKKIKMEGAPKAIGITVVVSFLTASVLAYMAFLTNNFLHHSFLMDTLTTTLLLWVGLTAARFITHDVFEQRPAKLTALNVAHELVTLVIMGLLIGLFKP